MMTLWFNNSDLKPVIIQDGMTALKFVPALTGNAEIHKSECRCTKDGKPLYAFFGGKFVTKNQLTGIGIPR